MFATTTPATDARRCDRIDRENQGALAVLPTEGSGAAAVADLRRALVDAVRCFDSPRGAWAVTIESLRVAATAGEAATTSGDHVEVGVGAGVSVDGRWSLTHVDTTAGRSSVAPDTTPSLAGGAPERLARGLNLEWSPSRHVVPLRPRIFDYDGDGDSEAVVIVQALETTESGRSFAWSRGRVWSGGSKAVELYRPALDFSVEDVRDVDGDGRPDLVTRGPYAGFATVACGSEEPYPVRGPTLLAHAIAGGRFSFADAVAVAFAEHDCPALPAHLLVSTRAHPDFIELADSLHNLACARLWGADARPILDDIRVRCHQSDNCPTCDDKSLLERWATIPPPVRFAPP